MSDKKYVVYYHEKVNESRFNMNEQYSDFELIERAKNELNERLQEQSY